MRKLAAFSIAALALAMGGPATAALTFSSASGTRAASATFDDLGGGQLKVTLTNTSAIDALVPVDILTALFFNLGGVTLSPSSAILAPGSSVFFDTAPAGGNVGGEWTYASGLAGAPGGATKGISSAGFGLFGDFNFPGGVDLDPPDAVNGLNYGITSAGDNTGTGNAAVTGGVPLIKNAVDFLFTYTGLLDLNAISNVSFQYGTALAEPCIGVCGPPRQEIAEPTSVALVGLALLGLAGARRRKA